MNNVHEQNDSRTDYAVTKVLSVCSKKDIDVWAVAAKYILKNIYAKRYIIIVPEDDIDAFKAITPGIYEIVGESRYVGNIREIIKDKLPIENKHRLGWYLQQFIKLAALEISEDADLLLIWDADTIPLKPLVFLDKSGRLLFYKGAEYHKPYFDLIRKVLGVERVVRYSFIAQCFPIRGVWVREFFEYIEARHGKKWVDVLLEQIDFKEESGFSEYETLGAYISNKHPYEITVRNGKWLRNGNSLMGGVGNVDRFPFPLLLMRFDFVSFELWDSPKSFLRAWAQGAFPGLVLGWARLARRGRKRNKL